MHVVSGAVLASFPSPPQGVWHLGPIPLRAYALFIIIGIIVAIWWGDRRWRARGGERGTVIDIAIWAVPFGLVGGRLYHVCTDWWRYFDPGKNPWEALAIWDGGLGIPGAIALGALGAWIACRRRGIPLTAVADSIAPGIVTAQAIGRIGNYFNQELYGRSTDLPWGLEIYQRVDPDTGVVNNLTGVAINDIPTKIVQPTFLYELLWDLGVALLVVWATRRLAFGHGRGFALYVAAYAAGRSWVELLRDDPATHIFGVRINNWIMAILFVLAVAYIIVARRRGPKEDVAELTAAAVRARGEEPPAAAEPDTDGGGTEESSGVTTRTTDESGSG